MTKTHQQNGTRRYRIWKFMRTRSVEEAIVHRDSWINEHGNLSIKY